MTDDWTLWLYNLGASVAYRLEAAAADAAGEGQAATALNWEADRLAHTAEKHRARVKPAQHARKAIA